MASNKERPITDSGYSERQMDKATDQASNSDQTKAGNIFDPKKKTKPQTQQPR